MPGYSLDGTLLSVSLPLASLIRLVPGITTVIFEAFELSPTAEQVLASSNAL